MDPLEAVNNLFQLADITDNSVADKIITVIAI